MKYKIGVDFTYVIEDSITGIRKYGEEIINELIKQNKDNEIILFVDERVKEVYKNNFPECKIISMKFWFKNIKYIRRVNIYKISKIPKEYVMRKQKCDIIIYPYANILAPIINKEKNIVTIHDLNSLDELEDKNSRLYAKTKKENLNIMEKTRNIVTISEYSKRRLLDINPNYDGKITVIPNSIAKLKQNDIDISKILNIDAPYIFSINSFFKHKNQITLVKAFNEIKEKIPHKLVLVGRPELTSSKSMYKEILEYIEKNNLNDRVIILSNITDEYRNALFYNADVFVTNSIMEGFGRTPVEAALCKIPVISTRETSLPEVTMNEVYYYENALDYQELANKLIEVINNKPSEEKLEAIANKFENEYNVEKIAKRFIELINEILEGERNAKN